LGVGWINPRRVSDALSIRGYDSGYKGYSSSYQRDPFHDITCGFTGERVVCGGATTRPEQCCTEQRFGTVKMWFCELTHPSLRHSCPGPSVVVPDAISCVLISGHAFLCAHRPGVPAHRHPGSSWDQRDQSTRPGVLRRSWSILRFPVPKRATPFPPPSLCRIGLLQLVSS
jgi:hypothetical protein